MPTAQAVRPIGRDHWISAWRWKIAMSHPDAFALKNSGLNEFHFAVVGTELNGSPLTILSILARLGQDPGAEAARLTKLPKAAMIDCLAQSITKMPLGPRAPASLPRGSSCSCLGRPQQLDKAKAW
jgi:hypothetical protein